MSRPSHPIRPPGAQPQPVLCPICLAKGRAQRMWLDNPTLSFVCPTHNAVFTAQQVD